MGRIMQKRLLRQLDLELFLSQIKAPSHPKPHLEQYTTPVDIAAKLLHLAAYSRNDIVGKTVIDLGCGTGRLSIGAAFLGAKSVLGVDIDKNMVKLATLNSLKVKLKKNVQWVIADVSAINGKFDTVLQNPPFGIQKRNADKEFLVKALENGKTIYSLHKNTRHNEPFIKRLKGKRNLFIPTDPSPFLKKLIEEHGGEIKNVYAFCMTIPQTFGFHTKQKYTFLVDLYIITKNEQ